MKETLWFMSQYSHPYIKLKRGDISTDNNVIIIDTDSDLFKINTSSYDEALFIVECITPLLNYKSADFRIVTDNPIIEEIIHTLYTHGYILNNDVALTREKEKKSLRLKINFLLKKYTDDFFETMSPDGDSKNTEIISVINLLRSESDKKRITDDTWKSENFYFISLCILMKNAKINNPHGYVLINEFMNSLISRLNNLYYSPKFTISSDFMYLYSNRDIESCLYAFKSLLISSLGLNAKRNNYRVNEFYETISGINFALMSEKFIREYSINIGESNFFKELQKLDNHKLLASACYIQEYFINYRFTETIAPMISKRLNNSVKKAFTQYYAEEVGHEIYELETCINLDITKEYLENHLPLPLTQIFCDAFTYLSSLEPLSYFASVMITEGIPGEPSQINDLLINSTILQDSFNDASRKHEQLNAELNHQYLSRLFLSKIHSIDNTEQKRLLHILAWMVELNHRAWEELHQRICIERKEYLEPAIL